MAQPRKPTTSERPPIEPSGVPARPLVVRLERAAPPLDELSLQASERMRQASGDVRSSDPLVSFLYLLARDGLPCGRLEELVAQATGEPVIVRAGGLEGLEPLELEPGTIERLPPAPLPPPASFANGWLARWAQDVAQRLRNFT